MLHIIEIEIPNNEKWGNSYSYDFILPAKVRKIKGFLANAILGENAILRRFETITENDNIELGRFLSTQIGCFSLTLNKANTIVASSPLHVIKQLENSSINNNLVKFSQNIETESGSILSIVVEEKINSPFVTNTMENKSAYGNMNFKNGYKVNIYIEYDK